MHSKTESHVLKDVSWQSQTAGSVCKTDTKMLTRAWLLLAASAAQSSVAVVLSEVIL